MSAIAQRFGSGQAVRRIEDPALVAGKGQFTDDVTLPGQTWVCFQRSPYPHARIVSIDASAALALPGVLAVYSGADLVAAGLKPMASQPVFPGPGGAKAPQTPRHALGKLLRIDQNHDIGIDRADGARGLADAPEQQRQAQDDVEEAHHRQVAHRVERFQPGRGEFRPAHTTQLQRPVFAQTTHQVGRNAVARGLAGKDEEF